MRRCLGVRRAGPCRRSARRARSPRDRAARRRPASRGCARSRARPAPLRCLSTEPSTTAPIVSSSRFIARPTVPSSNSSSSLTLADGQTRDARDAVADLDDAADLLGADVGVVLGHVLAQRLGDLAGADRELGHHRFLFLVVSIQCGFVRSARRDSLTQRTRGVRGWWRRGAGRRPRRGRRRAGRAPRRPGARRSCRSAT